MMPTSHAAPSPGIVTAFPDAPASTTPTPTEQANHPPPHLEPQPTDDNADAHDINDETMPDDTPPTEQLDTSLNLIKTPPEGFPVVHGLTRDEILLAAKEGTYREWTGYPGYKVVAYFHGNNQLEDQVVQSYAI